MSPTDSSGSFEIPRESAGLDFEQFRKKYFEPELPCIIEGLSADWPATEKWDAQYLHRALSSNPETEAQQAWYDTDARPLEGDYTRPELIQHLYAGNDLHVRSRNVRVWAQRRGHFSSMHYDGLDAIFNLQVKGAKEWILIPPQQPLSFYPFTNISPIAEDASKLRGRDFARFTLNPGDMLFLPPFWQHQVRSLGEENINFAWEFAKRESAVESPIREREQIRCQVFKYFDEHRFALVRWGYTKIRSLLPGYVTLVYGGYPHFLRGGRSGKPWRAPLWVLGEWARLPKVIWDLGKIRANIWAVDAPKPTDPK